MVASMAAKPIIFAMANPDPEIRPEIVKNVRPDALIATGRSDYPNQINNVLAFPGIFRGALDVRTKKITEKNKLDAAEALAALVKKPRRDKIIPSALDSRAVRAVAGVFKRSVLR